MVDQIIDLHDRIMGRLLNAARHKHQQRFRQPGRRINDQLWLMENRTRAGEAKAEGKDALAAIEDVPPWEEFAASVAETGKLSQPEEFDFIHLLAESWPTIRRYAPALLEPPAPPSPAFRGAGSAAAISRPSALHRSAPAPTGAAFRRP